MVYKPMSFREISIPIGLAVLTFLLIFPFRAVNHLRDSLLWATMAETGENIFHSHHLLYAPTIRLIYLIMFQIVPAANALIAGQIYSLFWAIITIVTVYFIARSLTGSAVLAILASFSLLVSQAFWLMSAQAETYIPSFGPLVLIVALLFLHKDGAFWPGKIVGIALLLSISVFNHQMGILFLIPTIYYLIIAEGKRGWKLAVYLILSTGIIMLSAYILAFLSTGARGMGQFTDFILRYALHPDPAWGTFEHFSPQGIYQLFNTQLEAFIAVPWSLRHVVFSVFLTFFTLLIIWNIIQIRRRAAHYKFRAFFAVWILAYLLFFLWYIPDEKEYLIPNVLAIVLLSFITFNDMRKKLFRPVFIRRLAYTTICGLIFAMGARNMRETILPVHRSPGSAYYKAKEIAALLPEECTIFETDGALYRHLQYYHRRKIQDAWDVLLYFYYTDKKEPPYEKGGCVAINSKRVYPGYTVRGLSGYDMPERWLRFIEWLFDLEYDSENDLISCREFEIVTSDDGWSYIIIRPFRRNVSYANSPFNKSDKKSFSEFLTSLKNASIKAE